MINKEIIPEEIIQSKIMFVRGKKVILDKDIAMLYEVKPIVLRQQIKRNIERLPDDFMFKLNEDEIDTMVSQNVIPSRKYLGGHTPYVFTEQGIAMLSGILNSTRAIHVNIQIMRTFVKLREIMSSNSEIRNKIEKMEKEYGENFQIIFKAIKKLLSEPKKEMLPSAVRIGFNE